MRGKIIGNLSDDLSNDLNNELSVNLRYNLRDKLNNNYRRKRVKKKMNQNESLSMMWLSRVDRLLRASTAPSACKSFSMIKLCNVINVRRSSTKSASSSV